jgi:hypothetical protein
MVAMLRAYPYYSALLVCLFVTVQASCRDESPCSTESDCGKGRVCLQQMCFSADGDPDDDGLTSGQELEVGLNPLSADSDGDGIGDGLEWGTPGPVDTDGDGQIDGLESAVLDNDEDCLPDQLDSDDEHPGGLDSLVDRLCPDKGVCGEQGVSRQVTCITGVPACVMEGLDHWEQVEFTCDGLDNDCDGYTDEGSLLDGVLPGGLCQAPGVCGLGKVECSPSGGAICSSGPGGSVSKAEEEVCDGLDNDCNGLADDGLQFDGSLLGAECEGTGECGTGVVQCHPEAGTVICSSMAGGEIDESKNEVCDGLDNDCDGLTDEELFKTDPDACPTEGVCKKHADKLVVVCDTGVWVCDPSAIETWDGPLEVRCDGLDNNCDGTIDEEFLLTDFDGAKRSLQDNCGTGLCSGGVVVCTEDQTATTCSTWTNIVSEVCNSQDDDCDGTLDEGMEYKGLPVGESCKGDGVCGVGSVECNQDTLTAQCSTNPGGTQSQVGTEVCDQIDNDCDGDIDEDVDSLPTCLLPGVCDSMEGTAECLLGAWVCDYSAVPGWEQVESSCDNKDNDCDGWIDETMDKEFAPAEAVLLADRPAVRNNRATCLANPLGGFFMSGGKTHPFPWEGEDVCLDDLWFFNLEDGVWGKLSSGLMEPRWGHSLTYDAISQQVTVLGGRCGETLQATAWQLELNSGVFSALQVEPEVAGRSGHVMLQDSDSGEFMVVGGVTGTGEVAPSLLLSADFANLEVLVDAPAVSDAASCIEPLTNAGYIFGGIGEEGQLSAALTAVDLATRTFTTLEPFYGPPPRRFASLACDHDRLFLFGGIDSDGEVLSDGWIYDLTTGAWSHLESGPIGRSEALMAVWNESMVLAGGVAADGRGLRDQWTWQDGAWVMTEPSGPGNLAAAAAALDPVGRRFCVLGGFETGISGLLAGTQLWCRDCTSGLWEKLGPELDSPAIFATLSYDPNLHRFLLIGGGAFEVGQEPQPLSPVCRYQAFDLGSGQWSDLGFCDVPEATPGARSAHAAAVRWKDLTLWLSAGISTSGLNSELWRLQLDTGIWTNMELAGDVPLSPRYGHSLWINEKTGELVIVGGASPGANVQVIDLATMTASTPISVPGWFDYGFATLLVDDATGRSLLLHPGEFTATAFLVADGKLETGSVTAVSDSITPVSFGAGTQTPWNRSGVQFGGVDSNGITRGELVYIPMNCQ